MQRGVRWVILVVLFWAQASTLLHAAEPVYETVHTFGQTNSYPRSLSTGFFLDDGTYIGASYQGGTFNQGMIYKIDPVGQISALHIFGTNDTYRESYPSQIVHLGTRIYGITQSGKFFKMDINGGNFAFVEKFGVFKKQKFWGVGLFYNDSLGCIYGVAHDPDNFSIKLIIKIDFEAEKTVVLAHVPSSSYYDFEYVDGGYFYYLSDGFINAIYRISKNGGTPEKVMDFPYDKLGNGPLKSQIGGTSGLVSVGTKLYGVCHGMFSGYHIYSINRNGSGFKSLATVPAGTTLALGPGGKLWGVNEYWDGGYFLVSYDIANDELNYDLSNYDENTPLSFNAIGANRVMLDVDQENFSAPKYLLRYNPNTSGTENFFQSGSPVIAQPTGAPVVLKNGALLGPVGLGGANDAGGVVLVNSNSQSISISFENRYFSYVYKDEGNTSALVNGKDGWYYGVSSHGGLYHAGFIYRVNETNQVTQILVNFYSSSGSEYRDISYNRPSSGLVLGADGGIYGLLFRGREPETDEDKDAGALYRMNRDGSNFQYILAFSMGVTKCQHPCGSLVDGKDGYFYGLADHTPGNWRVSSEVVFKVKYDGSNFKIIYEITDAPGFDRVVSLTACDNDTLLLSYGEDGNTFKGALIRLSRDGKHVKRLLNEDGDGTQSVFTYMGALVDPGDGFLYGTHYYGITRVSKSGGLVENFLNIYDVLKSPFTEVVPGLTLGPDGKLYGAHSDAGKYKSGTYFSVSIPKPPQWGTGDVSLLTQQGHKALFLAGMTNVAGATLAPVPLVKVHKIVPGGKVVATAPLLSTNQMDLVVQAGSKVFVFNSRQSFVVPEVKFSLPSKYRVVAGGRHATLGRGLFVESELSWGFVSITNTTAVTVLASRAVVANGAAFGAKPNSVNTNVSDLLVAKGKKVFALTAPTFASATLLDSVPVEGAKPVCYLPLGPAGAPALVSCLGKKLYVGSSATPFAFLPPKHRLLGPR